MLLNPVERYYKKEGFNKGYGEGYGEGYEEGIKESKKNIAFMLIDEGFSIDDALRLSKLKREDLFDSK